VDGERTVDALKAEGVAVDDLVFDLPDPESAARLAEALPARHGGVDLVVQNGASMARSGVPAGSRITDRSVSPPLTVRSCRCLLDPSASVKVAGKSGISQARSRLGSGAC